MSITITDPALLAQITQASGVVDVTDPSGKVIARLHVEASGKLPPGVKSPLSDEQFEEARQSPDSGVPLKEFWKRVERGEWQ